MIDNIIFISTDRRTPILKPGFSSAIILTTIVTFSIKGHLDKKSFKKNDFGKFSVTVSAIDS